ncbi:MAG: TonB-dependent receptor [Bernardetiaceae bacterium]|nr:TonB-dependent receptor [Bernardetiaceae bacterium]
MRANLLVLVLMGLFAFLPLSAQEDALMYKFSLSDLAERQEEEEGISVASNLIKEAEKQPVAITTITRRDLQMSGARTLSEALHIFVPGYFLVEDQDDLISGFRGLAPDNNSKVMLLLNGQNLNTEFFWGPADAILNSGNFEYIERVEVIRGPGSVTLGQGALLGVINIVTSKGNTQDSDKIAEVSATVEAGLNAYRHISADANFAVGELKSYFYLSSNAYEGQALRPAGWAKARQNEGFAGGQMSDSDLRLRRARSTIMMGNVSYKNLTIQMLHTDQVRDLYNFYRDRNVFQQTLSMVSAQYKLKLSESIVSETEISFAQDDFALHSIIGTSMGGTREERYGAKTLLKFDEPIKNNFLAIGAEVRRFEMGQANRFGNNFIANVIGEFDPTTANQDLTMGYRRGISVLSFFAENLYSPKENLDFFVAFRYDNHPFWGNNISPRAGLLYSPTPKVLLRASYQAGFRGAVGLHYTGGYRLDGFLRQENHSLIEDSEIPIFENGNPTNENEPNIPTTLPERMHNFELAITYQPQTKIKINSVLFFNRISNVIDVGVIYRDPNNIELGSIGNDIAGDWNGFWHFRNTPGSFEQLGLETTISYQDSKFNLRCSHALVRVFSATDEQVRLAQQNNSMYLSYDIENENVRAKAYPEHVLRANLMYNVTPQFSVATQAMYYSAWYSPIATVVKGGVLLNAVIAWQPQPWLEWSISGKNLLNEQALSPMNSNAGDTSVSSGAPGYESITAWTSLRFRF